MPKEIGTACRLHRRPAPYPLARRMSPSRAGTGRWVLKRSSSPRCPRRGRFAGNLWDRFRRLWDRF